MTRVRGWCPSAHRPMMSGDGLLVRVRPRMARLSAREALDLADLAERFGNGLIDLTSRGNLQIRGVSEAEHPELLDALVCAGLVVRDPALELPLTVTPCPDDAGVTEAMVAALEAVATDLPVLPGKAGIIVDTGQARRLSDVSGDFRFERGAEGVILRADGMATGRAVTVERAGLALVDLARWFVETGGAEAGRMHRYVSRVDLPGAWTGHAPGPMEGALSPDLESGRLSFAFGQVSSADLRQIIGLSKASCMVVTPWRLIVLADDLGRPIDISARVSDAPGRGTDVSDSSGSTGDILVYQSPSTPDASRIARLGSVITDISDPLLQVVACPGVPACAQATVDTRDLARRLAPFADGTLHVSGCAKSCAARVPFSTVLVGREGSYDVIRDGEVGDTPSRRGLSAPEVLRLFQTARRSRGAGKTTTHKA